MTTSVAPEPRLSLLRQQHPLATPAAQRAVLSQLGEQGIPAFADVVMAQSETPLTAGPLEILQINVGKVCNQTCHHCHVDAGPDRREQMSPETIAACLRALQVHDISMLDITGGAPEMHPQFRELVTAARQEGRRVIDRCNLTILLAPGYDDLPEFLAEHDVEIVASMPCYLEANVDRQRGHGVFDKSIAALQQLSALGYGQPGSSLKLTLVYNPGGPSLPPPQSSLETAYREQLRSRFGIEFTQLFTITNMPISRFLEDLLRQDRLVEYMDKLVDAFNPATLPSLMCRNTLSVDWTGRLFDCDFNQMLDLPVLNPAAATIFDLATQTIKGRPIHTGRHCFGCTAGHGSSCQGGLVPA
ncbi:radical SAM/Cys-rich domain protein [bacterium]|nr:radical SAM/Cys-rich domain protein [bacterium]